MAVIDLKTTVNIKVATITGKVDNDKLGLYAAERWRALYDQFVPFKTGTAANTVSVTPWKIEHTAIYASYIYEGYFNFKTDYHKFATSEWDQAAKRAGKAKTLASELQTFIEKGGTGL